MSQSDTPRWRVGRKRIGGDGARGPSPSQRTPGRVSAYVYGNIILFAALIPMREEDAAHGHALQIVVGAAVSTFLAHVFAEFIGLRVSTDARLTRAELRHELREAMPIVSSAVVPCLLLAAAWAHWLPASAALVASDVYLLLRLALLGVIVHRPGSRRTLVAGLAMAGMAAAIALLKVTLSH